MHKVLVNCLVKLAHGKSVVGRFDHLNMTIAVDWDVKPQTKQRFHRLPPLYRWCIFTLDVYYSDSLTSQ